MSTQLPWVAFVIHTNVFRKLLLQKLLQSECVEGDATKTCLTKDLILHLKVELTQLCDALLCCSTQEPSIGVTR